MGDFNAHLGFDDEEINNSTCIGDTLLHRESNSNGRDLLNMREQLNLKIHTTFGTNSTRTTWHRGSSSSQLDHILSPLDCTYTVASIQGRWSKAHSDHKLISCKLIIPPNNHQKEYFSFPNASTYRTKNWNWSLFTNPYVKERFEDSFLECLKSEREIHANNHPEWERICAIACHCAERLLKTSPRPYTPDQINARNDFFVLMRQVMRPRLVDLNVTIIDPNRDYPPDVMPGSIQLVRETYMRMQRLNNDSPQQSLSAFLDSLNDNSSHPAQRLQLAYKHLKIVRRSQQCPHAIKMSHWVDDLKKSEGELIPLLKEEDNFPMLKPPTFEEMMVVVASLKNGKVSGLDKVQAEI